MKPFFTREEVQSDQISKTPLSCASCGRYKGCVNPKIKPKGKFNKKILIVIESPGPVDDRENLFLQDRQGRMIQRILKKQGIDVFKDCWITASALCYKEGKITENEINCCRPKLLQTIKEYNPEIILLFGEGPLQSLVGQFWKKKIGSTQIWRGYQIPSQELNAWVCPLFGPWFIEYSEDKSGNQALIFWERDLKNALACLGKSIPKDEGEYAIEYVTDDFTFRRAIQEINKATWFSFDYETTGLKPHASGHQIICTSVAISPTKVYVWENTSYREKVFSMILKKGQIKKSAHNASFENLWSTVILNTVIHGWFYCTMNTAHILNNAKGICGLKFQTFVNFGVVGYDEHIAPYLESPPKEGANAFNRIKEYIKKFGIKPVLTYCALDSLYGYKLTLKQMETIKNEKKTGSEIVSMPQHPKTKSNKKSLC
jgi:uracil-DNA glycosylase family 4